MGVGKLQDPSISVGNLQVVVFVGNLTGCIFLVGKLPPSRLLRLRFAITFLNSFFRAKRRDRHPADRRGPCAWKMVSGIDIAYDDAFYLFIYYATILYCMFTVSVRRRLREATLSLTDLANQTSAWSVSGESPGTMRGLNIR